MDLMLRDANFNKKSVIKKPKFSCSTGLYGASTNDFELILSDNDIIPIGSIITYGTTEFGGVIKERIIDTEEKTSKYYGKSFRGQMENSIVTPTSSWNVGGTDYDIMIALFGRSQLKYKVNVTGRTEIKKFSIPLGSNLLKAVDLALSAFNEKMLIKASNDGVEITLMPIVYENCDESQIDLVIDENKMLPTALHAKSDDYSASVYLQADGTIGSSRYYTGFDAVEIWQEIGSNAESSTEFKSIASDRLRALRETKNTSEIKSKIENADIGDKIKVSVKRYGVQTEQTVCEKILNFDGINEEINFNTGG